MGKINKVAVFGMGKSGVAALKLARTLGHEVFAVNRGEAADWYLSEGLSGILPLSSCYAEDDFTQGFCAVDEIILSPGIPLTHPSLSRARESGVPVISEVEFAYRQRAMVPVIAVTGTNGKTTTTTMISEALRMAGKRVFCGGNIGVPYSEMALIDEDFDYAVIEVSSFQLETIDCFHPKIALILNVSPNHGERYAVVDEYADAKFRIAKNLTEKDHLILGTENPFLDRLKTVAKKQFFTKGALPVEFKQAFAFDGARVRGEHNEANFYAAYLCLKLLEIPRLQELFQTFIRKFAGVAHRLEYVRRADGLDFYNDAKSTNALATVTALQAFKGFSEPLYLILGGRPRNGEDRFLAELRPFADTLKGIFLIGEAAPALEDELAGHFPVHSTGDLRETFRMIKELGLKGTVIFSPGFPSFDQFKNYVDRGEKFKTWLSEAFGD